MSAHIADLGFAGLAVFKHGLQAHSGYDAGDIAGLINVVKIVAEIVQARGLRACARRVAEEDLGIFRSGLFNIALVSEAIGEDDIAALLDKINCRVIALLVLRDGIFEDKVLFSYAQIFDGVSNAFDVSVAVALVFVADEYGADLELGSRRCRCCTR